jgi:hypothetical protein
MPNDERESLMMSIQRPESLDATRINGKMDPGLGLTPEKLCTFATSHFDSNSDIKILPDTPRAR